MPFDPCLSLIQTPPAGRALFEAGVPAAAARSEPPPTPTLQFAGMRGDRFKMGTLFETRDAMADMYLSYTLPEGQKAMLETNLPMDVSREELELQHVIIEDDVEVLPYGLHPPGDVAGYLSSNETGTTPETYLNLVKTTDWLNRPVPGRLAHFAFVQDGAMRFGSFWKNREIGDRWHNEELMPAIEAFAPGTFSQELLESGWLELTHFMVGAEPGSRVRHFTRSEPGAIPQ